MPCKNDTIDLNIFFFLSNYYTGGLYDITGSYDASYFTAGAVSAVAFLILLVEPLLLRLQVRVEIWRGIKGH